MFDVLSKPKMNELKKMKLFVDVPEEIIKRIVESFLIRRLKKKEVLLVSGQPNHYLYQVLSGKLCVFLEPSLEEPVCCFGPGEPVGELSIIDNSLTSAYVVAEEDSRLLVLEGTQVWSLVEESHAFSRNLLKSLSQRLRQANQLISNKTRMEESFYHYGMLDVLTGMHSRRWFEQMIHRTLRRCTLQGKPFSLLMTDIDNFKSFNDSYGRICGDLALNKIAFTIQEHLRATELAVRYEGDKLLVILPETDLQQSRMVAERLRLKIMYTDIPASGGRKLPSLTLSVGIAQAIPDQSVEELMHVLMVALNRAKAMGRNYVSD
jgi:diguanylate cyclase (GGDEF)-like protein